MLSFLPDSYKTVSLAIVFYCIPFLTELEQDYLEPLKSHFIKKDLTFRKLVLSTLTSLFTNLVTSEWPRHKRRTEATEQDSITSTK